MEHQKLLEKPKQEKIHRIACKFTIIERLQGEKENLTVTFYNSFQLFFTKSN